MDDTDVILKRLERLEAEVASLRQENQRLRADNAQLRDEITRLKKNSSNSSKPPSSDILSPPKPAPPRGKKRKAGGQHGHRRHQRPPFDAAQIDQVVWHELAAAEVRRRRLKPLDDYARLQQVELLDKPYIITEHRARRYRTVSGAIIAAPMPPEIRRAGLLGPRMTALVGWLKARGHVSYRGIAEMFADVLALRVSCGELADRCTGMLSASLQSCYEQLAVALRHEPVLGSDETGHEHAGKNFWTWCLRAPKFTVFRIDPSRGAKVLEELLGKDYGGILTVDYFSANRAFADRSGARPQYCWAHLLREIKFLLTLDRRTLTRWAEALLKIAQKLFRTWHARADDDPHRWQKKMERYKQAFLDRIRRPPSHHEAAKLARRFDRRGAVTYFRFVDHGGVEPTNNATERTIRQPVLDRRVTQGTRSSRGIDWCQRAWSAVATCVQQQRSTFRFFVEALAAHLAGAAIPSLLPANP